MPRQEDISQQLELLDAHRQTLAVYLKRMAIVSEAYVPPEVVHGIATARSNIFRIKTLLHSWNVEVDDLPDDEDSKEYPSGNNAQIRNIYHPKTNANSPRIKIPNVSSPYSSSAPSSKNNSSLSLIGNLLSNRTIFISVIAGLLTVVAASVSLNAAPERFFPLMLISGGLWTIAGSISLYQDREKLKSIRIPLWHKILVVIVTLIATFLGPWYLIIAILSLLKNGG